MKTPLSIFTISYTSNSGGVKEDYVVSIENPNGLVDILSVVENALRAIGFEHKLLAPENAKSEFESNPIYDLED